MSDDDIDFNQLCAPNLTAGINKEAVATVLRAEAHYYGKRAQLQQVVDSKDCTLSFPGAGELKPGTKEHQWFRHGIAVALDIMGDFPLRLRNTEEGQR